MTVACDVVIDDDAGAAACAVAAAEAANGAASCCCCCSTFAIFDLKVLIFHNLSKNIYHDVNVSTTH